MAFGNSIRAALAAFGAKAAPMERREPRFMASSGAAIYDFNDPAVIDFLRNGQQSTSGAVVNEHTVLSLATAWRCASLICGVMGSLPCDLFLRESESARTPAISENFRDVLTVRPNNRQTPAQFKSLMQLHKLQRGNAYAWKIRVSGQIVALWPLQTERMQVLQRPDGTLVYRYSRLDGTLVEFAPEEIWHLMGLSWDGKIGLSVIRYMAESAGLAISSRKGAAKMLRNGQLTPGYLKTANALSDQAYTRLKADIDENAGVDSTEAGKTRILEEGLEFQTTGLTAEDAQLVSMMGFSRSDIGMFYGVPPHLYGDTDKSTSWGTGIEQQNIGFLQYTIQPHLTDFSEVTKRDCLSEPGMDKRLYVHFDLKGFLRADAATRAAYLARALGGGGGRPWMTQNEARAYEDMSPRDVKKEPWTDQLPEIGAGRITETTNVPSPDPVKP